MFMKFYTLYRRYCLRWTQRSHFPILAGISLIFLLFHFSLFKFQGAPASSFNCVKHNPSSKPEVTALCHHKIRLASCINMHAKFQHSWFWFRIKEDKSIFPADFVGKMQPINIIPYIMLPLQLTNFRGKYLSIVNDSFECWYVGDTHVLFSQAWHHLNGLFFGKSNALLSWLICLFYAGLSIHSISMIGSF
jgi:hypothetical protein